MSQKLKGTYTPCTNQCGQPVPCFGCDSADYEEEKVTDRAPDNQPTSNIRTVLENERKSLEQWKQYKTAEQNALARTERCISNSEESVRRWERYLAIRLAEEAQAPVEVTGL